MYVRAQVYLILQNDSLYSLCTAKPVCQRLPWPCPRVPHLACQVAMVVARKSQASPHPVTGLDPDNRVHSKAQIGILVNNCTIKR